MSSKVLTTKQRVFLLKHWWMSGKSVHTVNTAFKDEFPEDAIPARQTIYRLSKKFDETGSVDDTSRSGRPKSATTEDNTSLVSETFRRNPHLSQRRAARELNISRSSLQRIMKELKLKPYRPRLLQALNEDDPHRRVEFCEWFLDSVDEDPTLLDRILWSDEATFYLNGHVNRHNCVYWSDTNPHFVIEQELNALRVTTWGRIWSQGIVGPFFFENTVTSDNYLRMLKNIRIFTQ